MTTALPRARQARAWVSPGWPSAASSWMRILWARDARRAPNLGRRLGEAVLPRDAVMRGQNESDGVLKLRSVEPLVQH
jgi:hypothetical protein